MRKFHANFSSFHLLLSQRVHMCVDAFVLIWNFPAHSLRLYVGHITSPLNFPSWCVYLTSFSLSHIIKIFYDVSGVYSRNKRGRFQVDEINPWSWRNFSLPVIVHNYESVYSQSKCTHVKMRRLFFNNYQHKMFYSPMPKFIPIVKVDYVVSLFCPRHISLETEWSFRI